MKLNKWLLSSIVLVALSATAATIFQLSDTGVPDYDDVMEYQIVTGGSPGGSRKATVAEIRGEAGTAGIDANWLCKPQVNYIDATVVGSTIVCGGDNGTSSRNSTYGEGGGSNTERNEIGAGPAYVAGSASYATLVGGYDNRNDQLAGTIGGGAHHLLQSYGSHGLIGGGSQGYILGPSDRSVIVIGGGSPTLIGEQLAVTSITWSGGTATVTTTAAHKLTSLQDVAIRGASPAGYNGEFSITATANNTFTYTVADPGSSPATGTIYAITGCSRCAVLAGRNHELRSGVGNVVLSGEDNDISSGGNYSTILGGEGNTIDIPTGTWGATTSTDYAAAGGYTVTVRDDYGFAWGQQITSDGLATAVFGSTNTVSAVGDFGLAVGNTNTLQSADSVVWGERAASVSEGSMCHSKGLQTGEATGGAQRCIVTDHKQTTSTTPTTLFNISVLDHTVIVCEVKVSVRGQGGAPPTVSAWDQTYTAYRTNSGNVTQIALTSTDLTDGFTATDPSLAADTTFRLSITPPSASALNWVAAADCIFNTGA